MHDLPVALRRYLLALDAACVALIVYQVWAAYIHGGGASSPPLAASLVFALLIFAGDHTLLQMRGATGQSLETTAQVVALLILPQPFPLVVSVLAIGLSQALYAGMPLHKRVFNIVHPSLAVGLAGMACALLVPPDHALAGGMVAAAVPLVVLVASYYILDVGLILAVFSLLEWRSPSGLWLENYRATLLPELASAVIGVVGAILWRFDPPALALMVLPTAALRSAFAASARAEGRSEELARHKARLEAVLEAADGLGLQAHPADLLAPVARAARLIAGADSAILYLRDEEELSSLRRVLVDPPDAGDGGLAVLGLSPPDDVPGVSAYRPDIVDGGGPLQHPAPTMLLPFRILAGLLDRLGSSPSDVPQSGSLRLLMAPDPDGIFAALLLRGVAGPPGPQVIDTLSILSSQADIALRNLALHLRALALAAEDELTGLPNRRALLARLDEEVARAATRGHPLALLMVDVDAFSVVNDTYGHLAGDVALRGVADVLRAGCQPGHVAARYGGDEFVVLLPEAGVELALATAERMRSAVARRSMHDGDAVLRVSVSVGVAVLPLHAAEAGELLRASDQAAYAAKHGGKDRVALPDTAVLALDRDPEILLAKLAHANMATVAALAAAVDAKDPYTQGHSQRVATYAAALGTALGLDPSAVARIELAGQLHDVGKIGVSDAVLTKPGRLDPAEMAAIREHPAMGERMLRQVPFLRDILPAVRSHHERWDGQGYPDGLMANDCPPDGSILAVADALDAMTSSRTYRGALPLHEARRRLIEGSGSQFAPHVVAAFERCLEDGSLDLIPTNRLVPLHLFATPPIQSPIMMRERLPAGLAVSEAEFGPPSSKSRS